MAAPPTSHPVLKKIPIPGQGSWDYLAVDESARRLYVQDGVQVEVLDIDTGALVGNVPNTLGVHGIAIAPELGRGFVSNGQTSTVTIFEVKTLKPITQVPTGQKPDAMSMAIDRLNRRLFLGCRSKVMAVISADTGQVIVTLPIGDHVDATAFDAESKLIFNSNGEGTISVIRDKYSPFETVKTVPRAKTMALDTKAHQLFLSTSEGSQFEYWWSGNNRT